VHETSQGLKQLVAYYVSSTEGLDAQSLREHVAMELPEHMVPAAFMVLEELPLTTNGKVDRRALPAPDRGAYARRGYEAPLSQTEVELAEIWSDVLGVERVGRWDNFFELGGHSLLAVQAVRRIGHVLDVELSVRQLFEQPDLAGFAASVVESRLAQFDSAELERLLRDGTH